MKTRLTGARNCAMRGLEMIKQKVKEWLSVWLFITIAAVGLVTLAVLMPFLAGHRMIEGYKEKRLFDKKEET